MSRISESGRRYTSLNALDVVHMPAACLKLAEFLCENSEDEQAKMQFAHFKVLLRDFERLRKASMGQAYSNVAADFDCGHTGC
ncbi:MAG: hypothetical protein AAGG48_26685 [Planctomycetota bacterium]